MTVENGMDSMSADFEFVCVVYPLWFKLAVLATVAYAPLAVWLSRRSRYPALLCLLPIGGNLIAAFMGLARVLEGMSLLGGGRRASAAGAAEAQILMELGAAIGLFLSLILILRPPRAEGQEGRDRRALMLGTAAIAGLLAMELYLAMWIAAPGRVFSETALVVTRGFASAAALLFVLLTVIALRRASNADVSRRRGRGMFVGTALFVLAALAVVHYVSTSLQAIATGGDSHVGSDPDRGQSRRPTSGTLRAEGETMFDFLTGTKRPAAGTPVLAASDVLARLKGLDRETAPWRVVDGSAEGVDLIAEWKIVDARWYEIFAKASLTKVFRVFLKLDEGARHVRAQDREYEVSWRAGVPSLSFAVKGFKGQSTSVEFGQSYGFKEDLSVGTQYEYFFKTSEIKKPIQEAVLSCGWVYKGVAFGKP